MKLQASPVFACSRSFGARDCVCRGLARLPNMQVLPYLEFPMSEKRHAPLLFLTQIDTVQKDILEEIGLSAGRASV